VSLSARKKAGVPLDKSEGGVKDKNILPVFLAPLFAREVEDQDSGNLTLNHSAAEHRSTNHRFDLASLPVQRIRTGLESGHRRGNVARFPLFSTPPPFIQP
jgi:hypothetical protein